MSKNTNLSFLTDYITADITNGRIGINNASPTVAFDVSGATKISGALTLTSTISNGTYTYTLPSATGTLALTNAISGTTNYVPKFTSSSAISNSQIFDNGTNVGVGTTSLVADALLPIQINAVATTGQAYFASNNNGSYGLLMGYDNANGYARIRNVSNTALTFETNNTEKVRVTAAGNVGIGTSSPAAIVHALKSNATAPTSGTTPSGYALSVGTENGNNGGLWFSADFGGDQGISGIAGSRVSGYETDLRFYTNNTNSARAFSERMRITSGGLFKFQNDGSSLESSTTGVNEFNTNANDTNVLFRNTATSLTNPRAGIDVFYRNAAPNSTSAAFYQGADFAGGTRTLRFEVRSNGGIANYTANDVNLSDIRTKKDIVPLGSYWNKFKAIEIVKFKYKDQSHDDYNIGVISQQVESVAPEFVDADGWGDTPEDGIPLKAIYTADLYHATIKVLQEAMVKIENQQSQIEELKTLLKA